MKIAVVGAGAIGGLVAAYLKSKDIDVSLAGHSRSVEAIRKNGLWICGVRGNLDVRIDVSERLNYRPDLVILATKTQDVVLAVKNNLEFIRRSLVLTTQNGVQVDTLILPYVPKENIISSIVMFGATCLEPDKIVHNFEGNWIIGRIFSGNDETVTAISAVLDKIFPATVTNDIKGMKYLKLFVNANNCIPAILGKSMQEAFTDLEVSRISIALWKEGLRVVNQAGIKLVSLPDFSLDRLIKLTSLPSQEAARVFSGIMSDLSKEPLYGSILQSIKKGRPSEIDYINGEFVNIARNTKISSPLNARLVAMVHQVEDAKRFFTKEELISNTKDFVS